MKQAQLIFFFLFSISVMSGNAQGYSVGVQTVTYVDSTRSNRSIPVEVHYPATTTGSNTAFVTDSFPIVVFGHGFVMTPSCYYPFSDTLATRGYIFAFPATEGSFSPSHADYAKDLIFVYNKIISESNNAASPFYQHVVAKGAIAGHSMGGGCTVLSAQYSNPATCYFTFAEATTNPSSITAAPSMTKPYLSLSGSYDCIAPYGTNQLPTYDSSGSPCKFLIEITGASHCQFGVSNTYCDLGETASSCASPPLARTDQINTTLSYLEPYLDYYVKGESNSLRSFDSVYRTNTVTAKKSNCVAITPGIKDISADHLSVYPNPAIDNIVVEADRKITELQVRDYTGKVLIQMNVNAANVNVNIASLTTGIYLMEISDNEGRISTLKWSKQ